VGEVYTEVLGRNDAAGVSPDLLEDRFKRAFRKAEAERRGRINEDTEKQFWRRVVERTVNGQCQAEREEAIFEELYEAFSSAKRWRWRAGARTTLETLRERGYLLAILSNSDSRLRGVLGEMGITKLVSRLFLSSEIGYAKPDARIFRHVEISMEIGGEEILHVGDSDYHDGKGAQSAGWRVYVLEKKGSGGGGTESISNLQCLLDLLPGRPEPVVPMGLRKATEQAETGRR
jgi:putative hydrolase of the HAD superfamily